MSAAAAELLNYSTEVQEASKRIHSLLRDVLPGEDAPAENAEEERVKEEWEDDWDNGELARSQGAEKAEKKAPLAPQEDLKNTRERVSGLLGKLNSFERDQHLQQVSNWLHSRSPAARKDLHVLSQLDRDCYRRESERNFAAFATGDKLKKQERVGVKDIQQFCKQLHSIHSSGESQNAMVHDHHLSAMTDEELEKAIEGLKQKLAEKSREALESMKDVERVSRFLPTQAARENLDVTATGSANVQAEQERLLSFAKDYFKQMDSERELVMQALDFARGKPFNSEETGQRMLQHLDEKRKEVQEGVRKTLLEKRHNDFGHQIVMPSEVYLNNLRSECDDLQKRIQSSSSLKMRFQSDSASSEELSEQIVQLRAGQMPRCRLLDTCFEMLTPSQNWALENADEEDPNSPVAVEGERLAKKESDLRQQTKRITEEQASLHTELLESSKSLRSNEVQLEKQELIKETAEDSLELLEDHQSLILGALAGARSTVAHGTAKSVPEKGAPKRRPNSGVKANRGKPSEKDKDDDMEEAGEDADKDPRAVFRARSAAAVIKDAVNEVLGTPSADGLWTLAFEEDESGMYEKDVLSTQQDLLKALESAERSLQKEVQDLEFGVRTRVDQVLDLMRQGVGGLSAARESELIAVHAGAHASWEEMVKSLRHLKEVGQTAAKSERNIPEQLDKALLAQYTVRREAVDSCKATLSLLGHAERLGDLRSSGTALLPESQLNLREAVTLEMENREISRRLQRIATETEQNCLSVKKRKEAPKYVGIAVDKIDDSRRQARLHEESRKLRQRSREVGVMRQQAALRQQVQDFAGTLTRMDSALPYAAPTLDPTVDFD